MANDKDTLLDMGFDAARVDWALRATQNRGLQPAIDFLFAHVDDPIPEPSLSSTASTTAPNTVRGGDDPIDDDDDLDAVEAAYGKAKIAPAPNAAAASSSDGAAQIPEAKSIKCSVCGKMFKDAAFANYHADKSGHTEFEESTEEIKALTEEEKKAKLEELRARLHDKRAAKEAEEAKKSETIRRKSGKDMGKLKQEAEARDMIKEAEKKRREKVEEKKAREAIKAQIEADKRARAEKTAREKAVREGRALQENAPSTQIARAAPVVTKDYKETRLQIRLASGGSPLITTLPVEATLQEVAEFVASQTLSVDVDTVVLSTTFPRKQFARSDFPKTLKDLDLVPSAVLMAS